MSSIKLFKGVPWGSDGLNILRFPNQAAQTAYFDSLETYVPKEEINYDPRRGAVLTLQESLFNAREFNYLAWYDDNDNPLYFFIEDYEYLNDNPAVALQITEDVWQNTQFKIKINNSKVHRRHMPRWNGSQPILYPVDEGVPRSMAATEVLTLKYDLNLQICLIITNKSITKGTKVDGIFYYLTAFIPNLAISPRDSAHTSGYFIDPLHKNFMTDWADMGGSPGDIVAMFATPYMPSVYTSNGGTTVHFPNNRYMTWIQAESLPHGMWQADPLWSFNEDISFTPPLPTRNTRAGIAASYQYEPQAYSDNLVRFYLTDMVGNPLIAIPNNLLYNNTQLRIDGDFFSLQPQLRIRLVNGGSIANGTEAVIPFSGVDFPQSNWLDYVAQSRAADKQILENNISSRNLQTAISVVTGAGAGAAMGGLYSESFGNPKRVPALAAGAGAAMNVISGIGSLANNYIASKTERANFALNENKIRNDNSPPIGGGNWWGNVRGIRIMQLTADETSREIINSNYHYNGVVVDQYGPVPLRTRYYYDYIQTENISISGNINNAQRLYLAELFNGGVTVWHSETFTGFNYNYDNIEV